MSKFYCEILLYLCAGLILAAAISGPAGAEQITLSTYYPAPYGTYKNLDVTRRLYLKPTDPTALQGSEQKGMLITDAADNKIKRWDGSAWVPLAASSASPLIDVALVTYNMPTDGNGMDMSKVCAHALLVKATADKILVRSIDGYIISDTSIPSNPQIFPLSDGWNSNGWQDFGWPPAPEDYKIVGVTVAMRSGGPFAYQLSDWLGSFINAMISVRMASDAGNPEKVYVRSMQMAELLPNSPSNLILSDPRTNWSGWQDATTADH